MPLRRVLNTIILALAIAVSLFAQGTVRKQATVLVLPFENTSSGGEFNWVGESIANALTELLRVPGLAVVSSQERKRIQQRLKIPAGVLPSLATSLKLARDGHASLLVAGKYRVESAKGDIAAKIIINSRIILVKEGRFLSEQFRDGSRKTREIVLSDALGNLQSVQGQLAYQILYQRDKALEYSQNHFIELATKVPARAFEAYIKGMLTSASDPDTRSNFFRNAMNIYSEEREGKVFADAAIELGHLYSKQKSYSKAALFFSQIPEDSPLYIEGAFYAGLMHWQGKNYEQALAVLSPLAEDLDLASLYNTLGAISVEASRKKTKDEKRSAKFLTDGTGFLRKAANSGNGDPSVSFNYGIALMLQDEFALAADEIRKVTAMNPRDGEALFLLAKSLEKISDASAASVDDQARRALTFKNAYARFESDWKRGSLDGIRLRVRKPLRAEFAGMLSRMDRDSAPPVAAVSETEALITLAEGHYRAGRDEEAMEVLRRVLIQEPMSAVSYLILGKIHMRHGDIEQSVSSLKTALFWTNSLIDAHILLGRIYLQKGDCLQAKNYLRSALAIDRDNAEAVGLSRQVERCSR